MTRRGSNMTPDEKKQDTLVNMHKIPSKPSKEMVDYVDNIYRRLALAEEAARILIHMTDEKFIVPPCDYGFIGNNEYYCAIDLLRKFLEGKNVEDV